MRATVAILLNTSSWRGAWSSTGTKSSTWCHYEVLDVFFVLQQRCHI